MGDTKEEKEQETAVGLGFVDTTERRVADIGKPDLRLKCACGKPVEVESPQIDQCAACFNRK